MTAPSHPATRTADQPTRRKGAPRRDPQVEPTVDDQPAQPGEVADPLACAAISSGMFSPALMVHLARSPGSAVVSVRVEGIMDTVLAARIETLMDVL
jgi:hypothetical protein